MRKYRYRARVVFDAILESTFPDDYTEEDVRNAEIQAIDDQDTLYFGSDFDPEVSVTDVALVSSSDKYSLAYVENDIAYVYVELKVAHNFNAIATVRVAYSVDSCDDGGMSICIESRLLTAIELFNDDRKDLDIEVDVMPLIDNVKLQEVIEAYEERGIR